MGGVVKSITGSIVGKRGAKRAFQAEMRGLNSAIDEQDSILKDITKSQTDLRDTNISDIEGLASRTQSDYDNLFSELEGILQQQYDSTSALQQGGFQSNEERLLASFDDAINRSQQSFDYAKENLMPFIEKGQDAFNQYTQKAMDGFKSPDAFEYEDFNFNYEESPGYQFVKDEALSAAQNSAAAQGMGLSGATLKALQDRASGLASTDYGNQFNRAMQEYQFDRGSDFNEYNQNYNNQYTNYLNDLSTLSSLGNLGIQGTEGLVNRERDLANFEVQAGASLSDALAMNDMARVQAEIDNILALTGGQGKLAEQATQLRTQIDQNKSNNIINQRTSAQQNIDSTRMNTGSNISNLKMGKGQAEANYQRERSKLQGQLVGGIVDGGIMAASAIAGGAGAFGGASGLSGAMQGLNFGSEMANFGGGQTLSPQALNFVNTGMYQNPQARMGGLATQPITGGMVMQSPMPANNTSVLSNVFNTGGTGGSWLRGF